jgi:hypothetical protein
VPARKRRLRILKDAAAAYLYMYPLVVFGVSTVALMKVEKPAWETLSAPLVRFMSVSENRPANHRDSFKKCMCAI